jgi:hypothetical protein
MDMDMYHEYDHTEHPKALWEVHLCGLDVQVEELNVRLNVRGRLVIDKYDGALRAALEPATKQLGNTDDVQHGEG